MKIYICVLKAGVEKDAKAELDKLRDELLDLYSLYLETGLEPIKEEAITKAYEIHLLDPQFSFVV